MSREPIILKKGKRFHKLIQDEWVATTNDGLAISEKYIKRIDGRKGRVDILVEELGDYVSVIEIKATDWDRIKPENVKRNIRRQIRQIWRYIDSQLEVYSMEVCPGIIFPKLPENSELLELVEDTFNAEGIQVVWHDETIEQVKERNAKNKI